MLVQRCYLTVPISYKDAAKALGAKWDPVAKRWWAPRESELWRIKGWFPAEEIPEHKVFDLFKRLESRFSNGGQVIRHYGVELADISYVDDAGFFCPMCDSRWSSGYIHGIVRDGRAIDLHHSFQDLNSKERFLLIGFLDSARDAGLLRVIGRAD